MSKCPMRGHFRYLRFKTFPMTPRTPQCEVFWVLLSSSEHSGVLEDSKSPTFPSVGLHPPHLAKLGLRHRKSNSKYVRTYPSKHMCRTTLRAVCMNLNTLLSRGCWCRVRSSTPKIRFRVFAGLEWIR
jgi:hypothetical protein